MWAGEKNEWKWWRYKNDLDLNGLSCEEVGFNWFQWFDPGSHLHLVWKEFVVFEGLEIIIRFWSGFHDSNIIQVYSRSFSIFIFLSYHFKLMDFQFDF